MNERIKELADRILPNEKEFHQGDPKDWGYFFSVDELEKFAELIVKECMRVSMKSAGMDAEYEAWYLIKEHFGVEE